MQLFKFYNTVSRDYVFILAETNAEAERKLKERFINSWHCYKLERICDKLADDIFTDIKF